MSRCLLFHDWDTAPFDGYSPFVWLKCKRCGKDKVKYFLTIDEANEYRVYIGTQAVLRRFK